MHILMWTESIGKNPLITWIFAQNFLISLIGEVQIRTYPVPLDCEIPRTIPRAVKRQDRAAQQRDRAAKQWDRAAKWRGPAQVRGSVIWVDNNASVRASTNKYSTCMIWSWFWLVAGSAPLCGENKRDDVCLFLVAWCLSCFFKIESDWLP